MALQTVNFPVEFAGGLDSKTDPKKVVPGKLTLLENGTFSKGKRITKRFGYSVLPNSVLGGGTLSSSQGLSAFENELLQFSNNTLYSLSEQTGSWVSKGAIYPIRNTNSTVVRNTYQQSSPDLAINENISAYVYEDTQSGGVNLTVIDTSTGAVIQNNVVLNATGVAPKAFATNTSIFIFYISSSNLILRILNIQTPNTIGGEITLDNSVHSTLTYFDVALLSPNFILAYHTATDQIKVAYLTPDGVLGSTAINYPNPVTINQPVSNCLGLAVDPVSGTISVIYSNNTNGLCYTSLNSDFTTLAANTVIDSDTTTPALRCTPYIINSTQFGVFYEKATSSTYSYDHYVSLKTVTIGASVSSVIPIIRSAGLASKAFTVNSEIFVNVVHDSTLQSTYFCVRSDGTIVSKMMPSQAGGLPAKNILPNVTVDTQSNAYFPAQIKTKFISQNNTTFTLRGISLETMAFSNSSPFVAKEISNNQLISGGVLQAYDGATLSECGFHFYPENITVTQSTSGGSISAGTYQYFAIYTWIDRQGQKHRSSSSIGYQVTTTSSTSSVTHTIPTLRITSKSNVMIEVYRTQANGTQAYQVTSVTSPTYNSKSSDTITFVDTLNDSAIQGNEILYTSGGVLDNDAPSSASILDVNKNRALLAGLEDPLEFTYSKQSIQGEGIAFSEFLTYRVDPLGGPISTIKFMDDRIILFKNSYIFYVSGNGPDDTGNQNDFTPPTLITSDVGCPYPKSCVLTPMGLMFKTNKGIYLLDRSLNVNYIGADVEAYNSSNIVDATLMDNENQVRFITDNGVALIYDYFYGQWSIFTNHGGSGAALWKRNQYTYARSNGQVYLQSATSYVDGSLPYSLRIGTSWLKLNGLQGFQRVRKAFVLGDFLSDHKLRIQVAYDYEPFFFNSYIFNGAQVLDSSTYGQDLLNYGDDTLYGGAASGVYQFKINLNRQKCEAIQFLFDDIQSTTAGASYSLTDLTLEIGLKPGTMKLQSTKSVG